MMYSPCYQVGGIFVDHLNIVIKPLLGVGQFHKEGGRDAIDDIGTDSKVDVIDMEWHRKGPVSFVVFTDSVGPSGHKCGGVLLSLQSLQVLPQVKICPRVNGGGLPIRERPVGILFQSTKYLSEVCVVGLPHLEWNLVSAIRREHGPEPDVDGVVIKVGRYVGSINHAISAK